MKILAVDDNQINRKLLLVTLEAEGYEMLDAADGEEALEILSREEVDVVISDILMPNMDGYRLCHAVRTSEHLKSLPFIVYTSTYESSGDERFAMSVGADKFLRKPAPTTDLLNAICEVTDKDKPVRTAVVNPPEELEVVKTYSVQLVRKLEEKNKELEMAHAETLAMHQALLRRTDQLERSEEQFRSIFENTIDVFYQTDLNGKIVLISPSVRRYGYDADALIGTNVDELYANPEERDRLLSALENEATVEDYEITVNGCKGEPFVASLSLRRVRDVQGRHTGTEGLLRDITERKRLEAQLLQAQKMESVGRLAGGIAHDFNNLLTVIIGSGELAAMNMPAQSEDRHHLDNILTAADRAANLTRQLLTFARQQVTKPTIINLNELIVNLEKMLRPLIGEDVTLNAIPKQNLASVLADPGQIEQVIVNLAVNARDAMPNGGNLTMQTNNVTLDEEYARQHAGIKAGPYVMLAVSDTGAGMDETVLSHIFEPFYTTKEPGKGTGLGLATCYGIVQQSGGHIWPYSELGHGTTFKIYLPAVETVDAKTATNVSLTIPRGTETILLVEDEPQVRDIARITLVTHGYTVLEASNGMDALQIAEEYDADIQLVITDVVMPKMGGKELSEQLAVKYPDLHILYVSGYTDDAMVHHGILNAGFAFLQKPFSPGSLARKVREVLDSLQA